MQKFAFLMEVCLCVRRELRPECKRIVDWLWDRVPLMEMPEMDRVRFSRKLFSLWLREGEVIDRLRIRDRLAAKMWSFYKRHRRIRDQQWRKAADLIEREQIEWILSGDRTAPEKTPESKSMAALAEDLKRVFRLIQEKDTAKTGQNRELYT